MKPGEKKDPVSLVLYAIYLLMIAASLLLIGKLLYIQLFFKPDEMLEHVLTQKVKKVAVEAKRGEILDCKGRTLALSYPRYKIYMDCTVRKKEFSKLKEEKRDTAETRWRRKAAALSEGLAEVFPEKSAKEYYGMIIRGRERGQRYLRLGTYVERPELLKLKEYPLFNEPQYKGGIIVESENLRRYPFGKLARRTIGFVREGHDGIRNNNVGLEGRFDSKLSGTDGQLWLKKTDNGLIRNYDSTYIEAVDGYDMRTTLNIDYQDIADRALREQISESGELEGGCLVLMEVKTGAIRAMVNLYEDPKTHKYEEFSNFAVGRLGEPGSVFKISTLMTMLENGYVRSLDDRIPSNHGLIAGYRYEQDKHITDYERKHHSSSVPISYCVQVSSNYAFRYLAIKHYEKRPKEFIDRVRFYGLGDKFDFDLDGLRTPSLPDPSGKYWSKSDLGQVAMGYTVTETPLHILCFYNAIAGKGKMMKPYLVESFEKGGEIVETMGPVILRDSICSRATCDTITRALSAVTSDGGTATRLKGAKCKVAGKTGTSRVVLENGKYQDANGNFSNQGTFVGFFPAEDPQYSIICCVYSKPSKKSFYGGTIPAATVRTVVDKLYNIDPYWEKHIR